MLWLIHSLCYSHLTLRASWVLYSLSINQVHWQGFKVCGRSVNIELSIESLGVMSHILLRDCTT